MNEAYTLLTIALAWLKYAARHPYDAEARDAAGRALDSAKVLLKGSTP